MGLKYMNIVSKKEYNKLVSSYIKEKVSIFDLMSFYGIEHRGITCQVSCPFFEYHSRQDISKSARIYEDTNKFYCFVCTEYPIDVVNFVMRKENIKFYESINWFHSKFNVVVPKVGIKPDIKNQINTLLKNSEMEESSIHKVISYGENLMLSKRDKFDLDKYIQLWGIHDDLILDKRNNNIKDDLYNDYFFKWLEKIKQIVHN